MTDAFSRPTPPPEDIILGNLAAIDRESSSVTARKDAHLYEFARMIVKAYPHVAPHFSDEAFGEACRSFFERRAKDIVAGDDRCSAEGAALSCVTEQIFFCSLLLPEKGSLQAVCDALPLCQDARVAYVSNRYADQAYRQLSSRLVRPTEMICEDYTDVCDSISGGRADYGILPIESFSEGRLLPFRRMINQNDFKIVAASAVASPNRDLHTLFVLLSPSLTIAAETGNNLFLELTVPSAARDSIARLLKAASLCHLSVEKIDAIPLSYDERGCTTDLLFHTEGSDLTVFLLWTKLFFPGALPVGIFSLPDSV